MVERVDIGDWCTLYHADGTAMLDMLRAHKPDAVIMDPPYGLKLHNVGYKRGDSGAAYSGRVQAARGDVRIAGDDVGADLAPWLQDWPQVLLWGADHLRAQLPAGGRLLAWDKLAGRESWDSFTDVEFGWHSEKGAARIVSYLWKGLACAKTHGDTGWRDHPMQKPIRVMEWCIEQCRLEPGATILDPYMGSGTTAIAAFKRRMKFVGVEIDRRWFDVAVERIKRQTGDGPLFEAAE